MTPGHGSIAATIDDQADILGQRGISSTMLMLALAWHIRTKLPDTITAAHIVVPHITQPSEEELVYQAFTIAFADIAADIIIRSQGRAEYRAALQLHDNDLDFIESIAIITATNSCKHNATQLHRLHTHTTAPQIFQSASANTEHGRST